MLHCAKTASAAPRQWAAVLHAPLCQRLSWGFPGFIEINAAFASIWHGQCNSTRSPAHPFSPFLAMPETLTALDLPACDTARRFVRVTGQRSDGLVAFEYAIGWPDLFVDLLLPAAAFAEFCKANRVTRLDH
jgi:phenol/toluene 2-monooxygenase (NADH) P0/A0